MESIHKAIVSHNNEYVQEVLLQNLDQLNATIDDYGGTVLHACAQTGNLPVILFVLSEACNLGHFPVNVNIQTIEGYTPLHFAAKFNQINVVEVLLSADADPNLVDGHGRTPLHWAAENHFEDVGCALLKSPSIDINLQDLFGRTALHWASKKGQVELVSKILQSEKALVNTQTNGGETALHWACLEGHINVVILLLQRGANPTLKNSNEQTPLDISSKKEVKDLLQASLTKSKEKENENESTQHLDESTSMITHLSKPKPVKKI